MSARRLLLWVLAIALLVAGIGLGIPPQPAAAAPKPIGLSSNGVAYTDTLSTSIFAGALIVPGDSVTRSFWVKNRAATSGNLAIALQNVSGIDSILVSALSASAVAGGAGGTAVPFTSAAPCHTLVSALLMPPGSAVKVDVTVTLGSLNDVTGQGSAGNFDLGISLTSTDVPAPDGCSGASTGGTTPGGSSGPGPTTAGLLDTSVISGAASGDIEPDEGFGGTTGTGTGGVAAIIDPNSAHLYQELYVLGWLIALLLGGIFAWWRSRKDPEGDYT